MAFLSVALSGIIATAAASPPSYPQPNWPQPSWGWPTGGGWGPPQGGQGQEHQWGLSKFTSLVVFGDSYSDDSRLGYFGDHNCTAPPVGWVDPANYHASSGGRVWPQYVKQYAGVNLYNYAVSGAVCSNNITPRTFEASPPNCLFPAIEQYEVPAWIADSKYVEPNGTKFEDIPADETVYAMWIGTNDLGVDCLLTDSQVEGTNITTYTDCVFNQLQAIYDNGARYFVLFNIAPLNLAPLYGLPDAGGTQNGPYWPNKPSNITEVSYRMLEQVVTVNDIYKLQTPFVSRVSQTFPGAKFALFNVHDLMTDIYYNPSEYLNGTAPLNVTAPIHQCDVQNQCTTASSPDSYMWYDDLHPSEQTDRVIASAFVDVVKGNSKWTTYWS